MGVPALAGFAIGHPILGTQQITTSQLFAIDPNGRWARTFSRYYVLENERSFLEGLQ
jgi:hypothetical protein